MRCLSAALLASALLVSTAGAAAAHEIRFGSLVIGHPWAKPWPEVHHAMAGCMRITNTGQTADRLVSVTAGIAPAAQLHGTAMQDGAPIAVELGEGIALAPGTETDLKMKSLHILFLGVTSSLVEGQTFDATLTFEKAGTITVPFEMIGDMDAAGTN